MLYDIRNLKAKDYEEASQKELDSIERFHTLPKRIPVEIIEPTAAILPPTAESTRPPEACVSSTLATGEGRKHGLRVGAQT